MKKELFLILKGNELAFETLQVLKNDGYNATVISTESLRKALDYYPGEHHFFNLRYLEEKEMQESVLCLFIVDDDRCEHLKQLIRDCTKDFKEIKGCMFTRQIDDYEGSI